MKKINKLIAAMLFMGVSVFSLTSCEKEEFFYEGPSFINFETDSQEAAENRTTVVNVPVFLSTTTHPGDVTVEVGVAGDAQEGVDFEIVEGKTLNFPAGVYSDTVKVRIIDNEAVDGNKIITLNLNSNSAGFNLGYPGPENRNSSTNIVVVDNDCPFVASDFTGSFTGKYTRASTGAVSTYTSSIKQDADNPNIFIISNFWGEGLDARVTLNGETLSAVVPVQDFSTDFYGYGPATLESLATPAGKIVTCDKKITFDFVVRVSAGSFGRYKAEFTKK
ncbi:Calx-beta domain-containing protein [Pontibacter locisalis]|uniref:Calx-beta domain-containing protein n=1 Tax=Pontibacter locisalis TaxID=1719035 RepID=A0ABW5IGZ1_9BACT